MGDFLSADSLAPRHCHNAEQDGDETGIDCGGSCGPCGRLSDAEAAIISRNHYDFHGYWTGYYVLSEIYNLVWNQGVAHVHYGYARPSSPELVTGQDSRTFSFVP